MLRASTTAAHPNAPTPADIARRNGALSKGPITEAGKARSARNATRHGICAGSPAPLDPEDAAALAALRAAMLARHQPLDEAETHWVEELVFVARRQQRLRAVEDKVLTQVETVATGPALPSLATLIRYRGRLDRDWRRATEELTALRRGRKAWSTPPSSAGSPTASTMPRPHPGVMPQIARTNYRPRARTNRPTPRSPCLQRRASRPGRARTNPDTRSRRS